MGELDRAEPDKEIAECRHRVDAQKRRIERLAVDGADLRTARQLLTRFEAELEKLLARHR